MHAPTEFARSDARLVPGSLTGTAADGVRPRHLGPPALNRVEAVGFHAVPIVGTLQAGRSVTEALADLMQAAGCIGGIVELGAGRCAPFRFVGPALSDDGVHAVWYSSPVELAGGGTMMSATAVIGTRAGSPFVHCHGAWHGDDGRALIGHLLADESIIEEPITVSGFGSRAAQFRSEPDAETGFTLFTPSGPDLAGAAFLLRVRPHEDILTALEDVCQQRLVSEAKVLGIGSISGIAMENGESLEGPVTEVFINRGIVAGGRAVIDLSAVDTEGRTRSGRLARNANPVSVTFELMVIPRNAAAEVDFAQGTALSS